MPTAFVAGALANKCGSGGEAWVRLSWIRGLERLGWHVVFVEQVSSSTCVDASGKAASWESSANSAWFDAMVARFGLAGRVAAIVDGGRMHHGLDAAELLRLADGAALLVNISGHLDHEPLFSRLRNRVYIDVDPGYTQFWHAQGTGGARLEGHHAYYTVGLGVGRAGCTVPTCGLDWRPLPPPVVLDDWPDDRPAARRCFTTVASWRGGFGPVVHEGRPLGLKCHEFRKFIELPRRSGLPFEIALAIHAADAADRDHLLAAGWRLAAPRVVAGSPDAFRDYVAGSRAECSVAQGIYVETASGWFSDRTVRYLASGRPALVQETGFSRHLPAGAGLLSFTTLDEAIAGAEEIVAHEDRHRAAARQLAAEHFDSARVIGRVIADVSP
mgnify:CR=1 FL=1